MNTRSHHASERIHTQNPGEREPRRAGLLAKLLATGGIGIAALTGCASTAEDSGLGETVAPAETGEPTPEVNALTVQELEIPAGLDAETLGRTLVGDRFSAWDNAGANDSLVDRSTAANENWEEFLPKVADENRDLFAEALYIDGWENDPSLARDVNASRESNLGVLNAFVATAWNQEYYPENEEGYRRWYEVQSVAEVPDADPNDATRTISVDLVSRDNTDKNLINSTLRSGVGTYTVTFAEVDGKEKVSAISLE